MDKTKTPLLISKSKINSDFFIDILLPVGGLILVLYFVLFKDYEVQRNQFFAILVLIAFTIYRLIIRLRNRKQIIIDSFGIKLLEENKFFLWKEIDYAFIDKSGYLQIITKREHTAKSLEGLKFSAEAMEKTIVEYSGRDIAKYSNFLDAEIKTIIGDPGPSNEIMSKIKRFNNYQSLIGSITLFGIIGLSIYLQVQSILNYTIGYGFVLMLIIMLWWHKISFKKIKNHLSEFNLSDEQIKELGLNQRLIASRNEIIAFLVIWGFITVASFFLTYMALNME